MRLVYSIAHTVQAFFVYQKEKNKKSLKRYMDRRE